MTEFCYLCNGTGATRYVSRHKAWRHETHLGCIAEYRNRAVAAELDLAAAQSAAHMPSGYPYGLPSWINQHLYAAYIGAQFPIPVMEQIRKGQLTFPEAPVYTELAQAQARIADLEAQAAQAWRPISEPPAEEKETSYLLRSFTKQHGYEYKIASWVSVVENEWTGRREHRPGGYWYDQEGDYIDIDGWQEWQQLPRQSTNPAPPK